MIRVQYKKFASVRGRLVRSYANGYSIVRWDGTFNDSVVLTSDLRVLAAAEEGEWSQL